MRSKEKGCDTERHWGEGSVKNTNLGRWWTSSWWFWSWPAGLCPLSWCDWLPPEDWTFRWAALQTRHLTSVAVTTRSTTNNVQSCDWETREKTRHCREANQQSNLTIDYSWGRLVENCISALWSYSLPESGLSRISLFSPEVNKLMLCTGLVSFLMIWRSDRLADYIPCLRNYSLM